MGPARASVGLDEVPRGRTAGGWRAPALGATCDRRSPDRSAACRGRRDSSVRDSRGFRPRTVALGQGHRVCHSGRFFRRAKLIAAMFLHGIFPPITTPFYPDGKIYHRKLEQNVEHYSRTPTAGIVVLGSTGEAILLSDDERREALKTAIDAAANEKVMIAGTGIESAIETLRLTEYAAEIGYDVAMVRTPHYYKGQLPHPANLLAFYRFVCDRSPLPVIIYNFPQATGYDIPAELVIELAEHPNLIGIKESSGSIEKVQKMVEATRHIQRTATVTETFSAVTGRMLQAASTPASSDGGALVSIGGPTAEAAPKPSSAAVKVTGSLKTRQKEVGFQVLVGAAQKLAPSLDAGAVGAILAFADCAPTAFYA